MHTSGVHPRTIGIPVYPTHPAQCRATARCKCMHAPITNAVSDLGGPLDGVEPLAVRDALVAPPSVRDQVAHGAGSPARRGWTSRYIGMELWPIAAMHVTVRAASANSPLLSPAPMASEAEGRRRRVRLGVRLDARRRCMRDPRGPQGERRVRGPRRAPVGAALSCLVCLFAIQASYIHVSSTDCRLWVPPGREGFVERHVGRYQRPWGGSRTTWICRTTPSRW